MRAGTQTIHTTVPTQPGKCATSADLKARRGAAAFTLSARGRYNRFPA